MPTAISVRTRSSLHPQIFRGLPAFALDDIEFNLRAFDEGAITGLLYFLNVNEDVPAAVAVLDETIAFFRIKPLHGPAGHVRSPNFETRTDRKVNSAVRQGATEKAPLRVNQ